MVKDNIIHMREVNKMKLNEYEFPDELRYNDDYSWVRIDGEKATVGVADFGAKLVKQFVFIELPKAGEKIKKGDVYVSLEAIKWSGHLKSPVSGEITEVNNELFDNPDTINKDPYIKGWIMKVKLSDKEEMKGLMSAEEAIEWAKEKINK